MKLKGISKLVLAGTALAATAATLTTATYAWYVTNAEVTVNGANGSVASSKTSDNLLVAQYDETTGNEHKPGNYGSELQSINYMKADPLKPQTYFTTTDSGDPVARTVTKPTWADSNDWFDHENKVIASGNRTFITYKFWMKGSSSSGATVNVYPTLTVTNTTFEGLSGDDLAAKKADISQVAYTATAGVQQSESFYVDAVYALHMTITKQKIKADGSALDTAEILETAENISVANLAKDYGVGEGKNGGLAGAATATDANVYYKDILGKPAAATKLENGTSNQVEAATYIKQASKDYFILNSNEDTLLTFTIWLEGSDESCYDSCGAQKFKFDWKFTAVEPE